MGGSAPRLQYLLLERVPFPGLPKPLSSSADLVHLNLCRIPHSGYISPRGDCCLSLHVAEARKAFIWNSNRLDLAQSAKADICPFPHALFSPPSSSCTSLGSANIWRTSWARIDSPLLNSFGIALFHQLWTFPICMSESHSQKHPPGTTSRCKSYADNQSSSFRLWHRSGPHSSMGLSSRWWNDSTSAREVVRYWSGKMTSKKANGSNFDIHLRL